MKAQPILLGIAGATVIILSVNLALRLFTSPRHRRWSSSLLFIFVAAGFGAGIFVEARTALRLAYAFVSIFFLYASAATIFQWPGFRPPPPEDEDDDGSPAEV